jgi:Leucine-rich repeat (LRR) protein
MFYFKLNKIENIIINLKQLYFIFMIDCITKIFTYFPKYYKINVYLNSLPDETTEISLRHMELTYIPDLTRFKNLQILDCSCNKLTYLPPLNDNLKILFCNFNKLSKLPQLNEKLEKLHCSDNKLTELPHLNNKLKHLNCSHNKLTVLPSLNENLVSLYCAYNELKVLPPFNYNLVYINCTSNNLSKLPPINSNLLMLYCSFNKLTELPYLNNLHTIECSFNMLYWLPPLYKVTYLCCNNNKIYYENIIKNDNFNITFNIITILNNFRYTYYTLKYKERFKRWLWEKVREPKIMKQFHPDHLTTLKETDDLEEFLEEWIK